MLNMFRLLPGSLLFKYLIDMCDYSKGFNRIDHSRVIIRLSDWGVPGWLLKILTSYLTGRSMELKYKGAISSPQSLPGGTVQGSELGILLFIVEHSDAGMDIPVQPLDGQDVFSVSQPLPAVTQKECRLKYLSR